MDELEEKILLVMEEIGDRYEEFFTLISKLPIEQHEEKMNELIREFMKRALKRLHLPSLSKWESWL